MYRLEPNALFLNQGDGRFVEVTSTAKIGNLGKGHGATFADFDADGDLDLYAGLAATTMPTSGPIASTATTDLSAIIWG